MKRMNSQRQHFTFAAPRATSVQLVGDFTRWQEEAIEMTKNKSGLWKTTVALAPGTYQYRFIVDGEWCGDPDSTLSIPNPYGGDNAVRKVA